MSCASSSTADAELAALFARRGRRALFEELQRRGFSVEEGSAIAAAIVTAIQEGQIIVDDAMDSQFEEAAQAMPPVVRQLLVENTNPEAVLPELLLDALGYDNPELIRAAANGYVMRAPDILSPRACALLRAAVDSDRRLDSDSVDRAPEHQLNLSRAALEALIGAEETRQLWQLPRTYRRQSSVVALSPIDAATSCDRKRCAELHLHSVALRAEALVLKKSGKAEQAIEKLRQARSLEAEAKQAEAELDSATQSKNDDGASSIKSHGSKDDFSLRLQECFVRRYSLSTRPWIPFHPDRYELTINVALSADSNHKGGRLLGVFGGAVQPIERAEGEATVHNSSLLHGVTRMTSGTRYSLICFFDRVIRAGERNRWTQDNA